MSVESEILRIQHNIADTYAAVAEKGGEVPQQPTSANLAGAVKSISTGISEQRLQEALLTKQDALTGAPHEVLRFDGMGLPYAAEGWSGRNLIINWDFRRPVNRNGKTEYVGAVYGIDRWKSWFGDTTVTLSADGMSAEGAAENWVVQIFKKGEIKPGRYTLSVLSTDGVEQIQFNGGGSGYGNILLISGDSQLASGSFTVPELPAEYTLRVGIRLKSNSKAIAAKLEPGDHQTLARQNEDGEWELIDPPDYDLQYALCSLYSPSTGEWVGYQHSNENLLHNWYWANKNAIINQRGETTYNVSATMYTIDRWRLDVGSTLTINPDHISLAGNIYQIISGEETTALLGKQITLSILYLDGTLESGTVTLPTAKPSSNQGFVINDRMGCVMYGNGAMQLFRINSRLAVNIVAVKAELGPVQTLARQDADGNWVLNDPPPNKALELAKCQRYQVVYPLIENGIYWMAVAQTATVAKLFIPLSSVVRAASTLTFDLSSLYLYDGTDLHDITNVLTYVYSNGNLVLNLTATGLTVGRVYMLRASKGTKVIIDANP